MYIRVIYVFLFMQLSRYALYLLFSPLRLVLAQPFLLVIVRQQQCKPVSHTTRFINAISHWLFAVLVYQVRLDDGS